MHTNQETVSGGVYQIVDEQGRYHYGIELYKSTPIQSDVLEKYHLEAVEKDPDIAHALYSTFHLGLSMQDNIKALIGLCVECGLCLEHFGLHLIDQREVYNADLPYEEMDYIQQDIEATDTIKPVLTVTDEQNENWLTMVRALLVQTFTGEKVKESMQSTLAALNA